MSRKFSQLKILSQDTAFLISTNSERALVVSDIHIGWEVALAEEGIHVSSQTKRLFERLKKLLQYYKPEQLVVLGDVKHTFSKIDLEEWRDVPWFFEEVCKIVPEVKVVPGNHDGDLGALLPESVDLVSHRGIRIGNVGLFHGHTWPDVRLLECSVLVMGHVHPVVVFSDCMGFRISRQVWVLAPCKKLLLAKSVLKGNDVKVRKNENPKEVLKTKFGVTLKVESLIIIPSFNNYLGGQAINASSISKRKKFEEFIGPVLRSGSINIKEAEAYFLDGTFLGTIERLRKMS